MQSLCTLFGRFAPIIWANRFQLNVWRKCAITLDSCISVMDKVKLKEQKISIASGPLYVHKEFKVI